MTQDSEDYPQHSLLHECDRHQTMLELALDGDRAASKTLVHMLMTVCSARIRRSVLRIGAVRMRAAGLNAQDLVQDVILRFYERDSRLLRIWHPTRGLSLPNWIGLIASRFTRRSVAHALDAPDLLVTSDSENVERYLADHSTPEAWHRFAQLSERVQARLSPKAKQVFIGTVLGEDASSLAAQTGLTEQAVYAARVRIVQLAKVLDGNDRGHRS